MTQKNPSSLWFYKCAESHLWSQKLFWMSRSMDPTFPSWRNKKKSHFTENGRLPDMGNVKGRFQRAEDFSGMGEWKKSPSKDRKIFPALGNVKITHWVAGKIFLYWQRAFSILDNAIFVWEAEERLSLVTVSQQNLERNILLFSYDSWKIHVRTLFWTQSMQRNTEK